VRRRPLVPRLQLLLQLRLRLQLQLLAQPQRDLVLLQEFTRQFGLVRHRRRDRNSPPATTFPGRRGLMRIGPRPSRVSAGTLLHRAAIQRFTKSDCA